MPLPKQTPPQPIKAIPHRTNIWLLLIPVIFIAVLFILYVFAWEESIRDKQINKLTLVSQNKINYLQVEIAKLKNQTQEDYILLEPQETIGSDNREIYFNVDFPFIFEYPSDFEILREDVRTRDHEMSVTLQNNKSTQIIVLIEKSIFESLEDLQKYYQKEIAAEEEENLEILANGMVDINNTRFYHSLVSYGPRNIYGNYFTIDGETMIAFTYNLKNTQNKYEEFELIDHEVQEMIKTMVINDGNL